MDTPSAGPPLLAIDPGTEKCGIAIVTPQRRILEQEITPVAGLALRIGYFIGKYGVDTIVLGDRTGARDARDLIRSAGFSLEIVFVNEDRSSELGRRRYLQTHTARGWQRLLPIGMRTPDRPYDDYVAVILAERYLDGSRSTRVNRTTGKRIRKKT